MRLWTPVPPPAPKAPFRVLFSGTTAGSPDGRMRPVPLSPWHERSPGTWRWKTMQDPCGPPGVRIPHPLADRAGAAVVVLARGNMNSVLVEFEDGTRVVTSKWAVMDAAPLHAARTPYAPPGTLF